MPATKTESLALRAARYFGIHDLPRTSIKTGVDKCLIVVPGATHTGLYVYDEAWSQAGRIINLTDAKRADLVNALQQEDSR